MNNDQSNTQIIAMERYGSSNLRARRYLTQNSNEKLIIIESRRDHFRTVSIRSFLRDVFLPKGFPKSVSEDYIEYQIWDSLQAFCSSLTGGLSTRAVLKGVGVGNETATVTSATITWLLKDGSGMLGRILFTWKRGTQLDSDCKKWRLFADVLNDGALFLDLISPMFPAYFTLTVCLSGIMKSIVGVAGGATRAALTQHQAIDNNMADVSAKDGSQETLVNLVALICSLIIIPTVAEDTTMTWALFVIFTGLHLYCNFKAVKSVCMNVFNENRYENAVFNYVSRGDVGKVETINKRENVWISFLPDKVCIELGAPLSELAVSKSDFKYLRNSYSNDLYFLNLKQSLNGLKISITLHEESTQETKMEAMFQALMLKLAVSKSQFNNHGSRYNLDQLSSLIKNVDKNKENIIKLSKRLAETQFKGFLDNAKLWGWNTERVLFNIGDWRASWDVLPIAN